MAIIESSSTPVGTHPSSASHMSRVRCDECGAEFAADCCVDQRWELHGERVGYHDSCADGADWCLDCEAKIFDD